MIGYVSASDLFCSVSAEQLSGNMLTKEQIARSETKNTLLIPNIITNSAN